MDRIRPAKVLLTTLLLATLAWSGGASAASEDIDTTFDAPTSPSTAPTASLLPSPATVSGSDSSFVEGMPFENLASSGSVPYERNWSLDLATTFARTSPDTSSFAFTGALARQFQSDHLGLAPRLEWTRLTDRPEKTTNWYADLGAYATWEPLLGHQAGLDAFWSFQDGPDDWNLTSDWSWNPELTDHLDLSVQAMGGWSKLSRGFVGASLGPTLRTGRVTTSASGSWNRRWQTYTTTLGTSRSSYLNVWGWSARSRWRIGGWRMGPSWSGEVWKTNLTSTDSIARKNPLAKRMRVVTVSGTGVQVNQSVGWSFDRTYLSAFHLSLDLAKQFGQGDVSTDAKWKAVQKLVARNTQDALTPDNSFSVAIGLGVEW